MEVHIIVFLRWLRGACRRVANDAMWRICGNMYRHSVLHYRKFMDKKNLLLSFFIQVVLEVANIQEFAV